MLPIWCRLHGGAGRRIRRICADAQSGIRPTAVEMVYGRLVTFLSPLYLR